MFGKLRTVIADAVKSTEGTLTQQLRDSASKNGWHPEIVNGLRVAHDGEKYSVVVNPEHADRAFVHEYGDETNKPTAVIRKFSDDTANIHSVYLSHLNDHYRGRK
jgi:hypothetical protein